MTFDKKMVTKKVICKHCGREFTVSALGGHMSHAHKKPPAVPNPVLRDPPAAPVASEPAHQSPQPGQAAQLVATSPPVATAGSPLSTPQQAQPSQQPVQASQPATQQASEPKDKAEELRALLAQGYTLEQLITEPYNFAETTVRQEWRKVVKPKGKSSDDENRDDGMLPMTLKATEAITPESIMQRFLADGGQEWKLRLEGMMLLRAAQKMVREDIEIMEGKAKAHAQLIKPILDLMKESREEQDAAAQRSRASVDEAATKAAAATAAQVANYLEPRLDALEKKKPDIATVQNPMQGMMARMMETMSDRLMSIFGFGTASQGGAQAPAGFTVTKRKEA